MNCKFNVYGMCTCRNENVTMRGNGDVCYGSLHVNEETDCNSYEDGEVLEQVDMRVSKARALDGVEVQILSSLPFLRV